MKGESWNRLVAATMDLCEDIYQVKTDELLNDMERTKEYQPYITDSLRERKRTLVKSAFEFLREKVTE